MLRKKEKKKQVLSIKVFSFTTKKKRQKKAHIQSPKQREGDPVQEKYNILSLREHVRSTEQPVSWRTALKFELSRVFVERKGLSSSSIMLSGPSVLWQPTVKSTLLGSSPQWQQPLCPSNPILPCCQQAEQQMQKTWPLRKKVLCCISNWISHLIFHTCTHKAYWWFKKTVS